jgi:putative IMPACT (imprinted ancient) family translation regulator
MLGALKSAELWNALGVVARSFGGTKLGRGGLVRAYRAAMALAIENAEVVETLYRVNAVVRTPIGKVGEVHKLLSSLDVSYGEQTTDGSEIGIEVTLPARDSDLLQQGLLEATQGEGSLSFTEETTG